MPDDGAFNSTDEQRRRGRGSGGITGRGFQPGRSGCPGGRPRQDVTELARAHTTDAIRALVAALSNPRERVPAAVALLNRGWGLPRQVIEAAGDATSHIHLHLLAARAISEEIVARQQQPPIINAESQKQPLSLLDQPPPLE